jgi:hypothetical protein
MGPGGTWSRRAMSGGAAQVGTRQGPIWARRALTLARQASMGLRRRPLSVGCDQEPSLGCSAASTSYGPSWPRSGVRWL